MDNSLNTFKGNIGLAIVWDILGLIAIIGASFATGSLLGGICAGSIVAIPGIVFSIRAYRFWHEEKAEEERIAREQEQKRRQERERNELFASGKWKFPKEKFYNLCQKNAATDMDNAFCLQKAQLLANSVLKEEGVPQQYHKLYNSNEKVKEYYDTQHSIVEAANAKLQQEYERKTREPQRARMNEIERATISLAERVRNVYGREKRSFLLLNDINNLSNAIKDLDAKIVKEEENRESIKQATRGVIEANTKLNNASKQNWGLAGGIADAIAGPGAGIIAAGNSIRHNAEIDAKNRAENSHYSQISFDLESGSYNRQWKLEREKTRLTSKLEELNNIKNLAMQKVVLEDVSTQELKKYISPKVVSIKRNNNDVLEVTINIKNTYEPHVPNNVKMVVDGFISADVYRDKILVGTAYAPFPLYGIPCGETAKVTALCPYYLEGDQKYTLKYKYHNLWVMEQ